VWAEAVLVAFGGLALGAAGGWVLSEMLVKVLTGVFDPAPSVLAVPWTYLGGVAGVAIVAVGVAAGFAVRAARRPSIALIREI
jgi:putative ABC transport system permease protein